MSAEVAAGIRRVGVVGAGVMGSGIAQWMAARGFDVVLRDAQPAALGRAAEVMRGLFAGAVARRKMSEAEAAAGLQRLATTHGLAEDALAGPGAALLRQFLQAGVIGPLAVPG